MTRNVEEVLPGIYKITLPVPISSLKTVFVYLVRDGKDNLLIDTGWSGEDSYRSLNAAFSDLDFDVRDLNNIVVSHLHPDHFGLSSRLKKEAPDSTLMMHAEDALEIRTSKESYEKLLEELQDWIKKNGAPDDMLEAMTEATTPFLEYSYPAIPDKKLLGGEKIRVGKFEFEAIHTPGHTRGNICLYDRGHDVLFSGDHILPTITPNVSLSPLYVGDPLGDYLASIQSLRRLGNVSKVLPSHEFVFDNLQERLDEIEQHHKERLLDCLNALSSDKEKEEPTIFSAYDVASKLKWYSGSWIKLSAWEMRAAVMETLAHLEHLKRRGKISEIEVSGKKYYCLLER